MTRDDQNYSPDIKIIADIEIPSPGVSSEASFSELTSSEEEMNPIDLEIEEIR